MSVAITIYIAIDDNTPHDMETFTFDPSLWSLAEDYGIITCHNAKLFAAFGYDPSRQFPIPLYELRGFPEFIADSSDLRNAWFDDDYMTWFDGNELVNAIEHIGLQQQELPKPIAVLFSVVGLLAETYGPDRVRVIIAFSP
ncbi:hypothetical protein Mal52_09430 [Symmachiella dynata]|uniref:Uncharacterized protein n=1 Tax=Symmachiella dynata TaxID=2527995 RepID=A0A517ZJ14_9PLAN|nr:hypothetical protein [Symmachiella dynata]QDU42482.1 hypothetical protein Mal52_09430 [Symmachiella dynata]